MKTTSTPSPPESPAKETRMVVSSPKRSTTVTAVRVVNMDLQSTPATFTLKDVNVSVANCLRRTLLRDIPVTAMKALQKPETCVIRENTSRFNNELIKHRLACIPVYLPIEDADKYEVVVDRTNDTDRVIPVTTEHFVLRLRSDGSPADPEITRRAFPPCSIAGRDHYIILTRLRPRLGPELGGLPGEKISLTATFEVGTAAECSTYNCVCVCAYGNTVDHALADAAWAEIEANTSFSDTREKENAKKNFDALDRQRYFVRNSFDFTVETLADAVGRRHGGHYPVPELLSLACDIILRRLTAVREHIDKGITRISPVKSAGDPATPAFDVIFLHEEYTIGKVVEYFIHVLYFEGKLAPELMYVGFVKPHPHEDECILRMAFTDRAAEAQEPTPSVVADMISVATDHAKVTFENMKLFFRRSTGSVDKDNN